MAIYLDIKTIRKITGNKYYRQPREFTIEELLEYDGSNGKPAYVAVEGIVYDLSNEEAWAGGTHFGVIAGRDSTEEFKSCHGNNKILSKLPKVGVLNHIFKERFNRNSCMSNAVDNGVVRGWNREPMEDTSKFTPDDWVRYITPLVNRALAEAKAGINPEHLYQEFILSGVLVGLGKNPLDAIEQVEEWEKTGESQLLAKSKMNRGYYY